MHGLKFNSVPFSCSSEIADVIAFLIFLFDVEKHTVFQTSMYVEVGQSLTNTHSLRNLQSNENENENYNDG